jgi:hypothetical protein
MLTFTLTMPPYRLEVVYVHDLVFLATISCANVANALITRRPIRFAGSVLIPYPSELSAMAIVPRGPAPPPPRACSGNDSNSDLALLLGPVSDFNDLLRHLPSPYTVGVQLAGGPDRQRSSQPSAFVPKIDPG